MTITWSSSGRDIHLDWGRGGRRELADVLRAAIQDGRLVTGDVLPSTRALAADLGVARGTVTEAYAQLAAEGFVRTSQGAPTRVAAFVAGPSDRRSAIAIPEPATSWDLMPGRPDLSAFPRAQWLAATRRVLDKSPPRIFDYQGPAGEYALREALARYLGRSRGVLADADRIVVCAGFSHAIVVLAHAFRESTGQQEIAFEDPSLPIFRDLAAGAGAEVTGVPVDDKGVQVSEIDCSVIVVTPAHQFPLGMTLAPQRRGELAEWATRTRSVVVEDDYDGEFRFDRQPVGALQALAPEHIVYAGTASKTLAPALRLGWLVLPHTLVDPVLAAMTASGWRTPVLEQLVLAELLDSGGYDQHIRRCRTAYRSRRDRLITALAESSAGSRLGIKSLQPKGIAAGLHLVLTLPDGGPSELDLLAAARRHSVRVERLGPTWMDPEARREGIIIGYAAPAEHAFMPAVRALITAIEEIYQ